MKVGILTYHRVDNFGANLQALSTVSFFKNRGDEVYIINWHPKELDHYYIKNISKEQREMHAQFVKEYLPLTPHCETSNDVKKIVDQYNFDLIVIGSDAVFSYIPYLKRIHPSRKTLIGIIKVTPDHKLPNPFWADFASKDSKTRIASLSASAQYLDIDKCLPWNKALIRKLLKNFDLLTVRDRWTRSIISKFTDKNITISPDPVFGFNINVKQQIAKDEIVKKYKLDNKYILLSFCKKLFSDEWYENLYKQIKAKGFEVINLAMPEGCVNIPCDRKIDTPLPPMDWYAIIKNAQGYIGQRMHPMIVAFNNLVPFFIFDHYAYKKGAQQLESSKIYDIVERAGMLSSYWNTQDINKKDLEPASVVNAILAYDKKKAEKFITSYQELYIKTMTNIIDLV